MPLLSLEVRTSVRILASGVERLEDFVRHVLIAVHGLDVVDVLDRVQQLEQLLGRLLGVDRLLELRAELEVGRLIVEPGVLDRLADRDQVGRVAPGWFMKPYWQTSRIYRAMKCMPVVRPA